MKVVLKNQGKPRASIDMCSSLVAQSVLEIFLNDWAAHILKSSKFGDKWDKTTNHGLFLPISILNFCQLSWVTFSFIALKVPS